MKTKVEVERMLLDCQSKIESKREECKVAFQANNTELYYVLDKQYSNLITKHNTLLEVLK